PHVSHFFLGRPTQPNASPAIRPDRLIVVPAITSKGNSLGPRSASRSVPRSPLAAQASPANTAPASKPHAPPARPASSNLAVGRGASKTKHAIAPPTAPEASHQS